MIYDLAIRSSNRIPISVVMCFRSFRASGVVFCVSRCNSGHLEFSFQSFSYRHFSLNTNPRPKTAPTPLLCKTNKTNI